MSGNRTGGRPQPDRTRTENPTGSLGWKIREARRARGLTQQSLAEGIVTVSMVSQIESDKAMPSYRVLRALAERLALPLEHFLSDVAQQTRQNALYKLAKGKMEAGMAQEAAPILQDLLQQEPLYVPTWKLQVDLAECYVRTEQWEQAEELLEKLVEGLDGEADPQVMVQCLDRLARARLQLRRVSLAIYHWEKACERMGEEADLYGTLFSEVYYHLGMAYARVGRLEDAGRVLAKAFVSTQKDPATVGKVALQLAEVLHAMGEDKKACQYAERAMRLFEDARQRKLYLDIKARYARYYGYLGKVADSMFMLRECAEEYRNAGHRDEWVETLEQIALLSLQSGRPEEAKTICRQALESAEPDSGQEARIRYLLSRILREVGDLEGTVVELEKAVAIWQTLGDEERLSEAYPDLVELYRKRGDYVRAEAALRHGLTTIRHYRQLFLEMG
ncbi:MAG TPA: tetratricopeptide repeat protein [Alicyclobacillus sp.]|nr:tetratricopeptide repeat protein [Alicyclobacillus sp.]